MIYPHHFSISDQLAAELNQFMRTSATPSNGILSRLLVSDPNRRSQTKCD